MKEFMGGFAACLIAGALKLMLSLDLSTPQLIIGSSLIIGFGIAVIAKLVKS